jgi:hypothetical protein
MRRAPRCAREPADAPPFADLEPAAGVATALFVVSGDAIRRSGAGKFEWRL